jgi:hypothetical protein
MSVKITSSKHQITNKFQTPNPKYQTIPNIRISISKTGKEKTFKISLVKLSFLKKGLF